MMHNGRHTSQPSNTLSCDRVVDNTQLSSFCSEKTLDLQLEDILNSIECEVISCPKELFSIFWHARKLVLALFKENFTLKKELWEKYVTISAKVETVEKQKESKSSYLVEQISATIQSIENDLVSLSYKLQDRIDIEEFDHCKGIRSNKERYIDIQSELNYIHAFTIRLVAVKNELIQSEITLQEKKQFFQDLARIGDSLFPTRKDLIENITTLFRNDVEAFLQSMGALKEKNMQELFEIKEEVKSFQSIAKSIAVTPEVFISTRKALSDLWESLQEIIQAKKNATHELRDLMRQSQEEISDHIDILKKSIQVGEISSEKIISEIKRIQTRMRAIPLRHDDVIMLKKELSSIQIEHKASYVDEKREKISIKNKNLEDLKADMNRISEKLNLLPFEKDHICEYEDELHHIREKIDGIGIHKKELISLRTRFFHIERTFFQKVQKIGCQEEALSTSDTEEQDSRQSLISEKESVKKELEQLRKKRSLSGSDIEKAFLLDEEIKSMKEQMQEIDRAIEKKNRAIRR